VQRNEPAKSESKLVGPALAKKRKKCGPEVQVTKSGRSVTVETDSHARKKREREREKVD
jgi:hypothetical protein